MAVNHSLIIPVIEASNLTIFSLAVNQAFKLLLTLFSLDSLRKNPGKKRSFHSAEKEGHSPPMMLLLFYWLTCIPKVTSALCDGVKVPMVAFTVTAAAQFAAAPAGIVATVPSVVAAPNEPGAPAGKQVPPVL